MSISQPLAALAPAAPLTAPVDRNKGGSAPAVCLVGDVGQGKTSCIRSLCEHVPEVFLLSTDPGWEDILGDIPSSKLKVHYVPSYDQTMPEYLNMLSELNTMDAKALKEMPGRNKKNYQQLMEMTRVLNKFVDQRTGQDYGDVAQWGPERAIVLDSLSGLTNMAERLLCGDKAFMNWSEIEGAQFAIEQFVNIMCSGTRAMFVMTAHLRKLVDKNTGAVQMLMETTGQAISPKLYKNFSDVIYCHLEMENGVPVGRWDTFSKEVKVKTRNLPLAQGLKADFGPLVQRWKERQAKGVSA